MGSKTYVNSSTQRLLDTDLFKHSYEIGLQYYLQRQKSQLGVDLSAVSLSDDLVNATLATSHKKFKKLRDYAADGKYVYGLPVSGYFTKNDDVARDLVKSYLESEHTGSQIEIISYLFDDENILMAAWDKLLNLGQYNTANNELEMYSNVIGKPCYLVDGVLELTLESELLLAERSISQQVGVSLDWGKFQNRLVDLYKLQPNIVTGTEDKLVFRYAYEQEGADITAPDIPHVNNFNSTIIDGYAEYNSTVRVSKNGVVVVELSCDDLGYYSTALSTATANNTYSIVAIDAAGNESPSVEVTYEYTNSTQISRGTEASGNIQTVYVTREMSMSSFFTDYGDATSVPDNLEHIQVFYTVDGILKTLNYKYKSGAIPELDVIEENTFEEGLGSYYPRVYTRLDAQDIIDMDADSEQRRASEKAMKMLGLDLSTFTTQINEAVDDINDEYKHIYLDVGLSPKNSINDKEISNYLFNYFERVYPKCTGAHYHIISERYFSEGEYNYRDASVPDGRTLGLTHEVYDNLGSHRVSFESIKRDELLESELEEDSRYLGMSIGEVRGFYDTLKDTEHFRNVFRDGEYSKIKYSKSGNIYVTYVKKVSSNVLVLISVQRLSSSTIIKGKQTTHTADSDSMTIPLDYSVVEDMTFKEKEVIFNRATNITIMHIKIVKEKWYETGFFKLVVAVVSVAMNVIVPGSGMTLQAIAGAVVTTIITSIAINIALNILVSIGIALGLSPEITAILAAVAIVAATSMGGTIDMSKLTNAKELMKTLNTTFDSYKKSIQVTIANLQEEMETFLEYAEDRDKLLKEAQAMLITGFIKPELELLTAPISTSNNVYLDETPEQFYTRTTTVDVSPITLDIVGTLLAVTTSLPKANVKLLRPSNFIDDTLLIN